jgi:DNA-binding MarR family transcriptional regulator
MTSNPISQAPPLTATVLDLGQDFGWALGMLVRIYHAYLAAACAEIPQGPRGYQVLATVMHGDQPNQLGIATHLGIDRTVMTYLTDDLVAAGLVERQQDPNDRRARRIIATAKGEQAFTVLQRRVREAEYKLLDSLSPEEQELFRDLLHRLALSVRHLSPETDPCQVVAELINDGAPSSEGKRAVG